MASNILLLQGPMGPFFKRLAMDFEASGHTTYKINFNAGDKHYFKGEGCEDFTGTQEDWPEFLEHHLKKWDIKTIYLFGDERLFHKASHEIATMLSIDIFVFEEGYLRPHYITLEKDGVNGRSNIPNKPEAYKNITPDNEITTIPVPHPYAHTAWYATIYFMIGWLGRHHFPHYTHHRSFNPYHEAALWIRAAFRKHYYRYCERGILQKLTTDYSKDFFLVPLQVHNDAQIKIWSTVPSAAAFIRRVISSFSKNAPNDTFLVIKHHPFDRGYSDYTKLINKLACKFNCKERVIYIHDLHLPTLLDHARGTIVLNSTVGLSSIFHSTPVKASGHAIYDIKGLTYQGDLCNFWNDPGTVDKKLYDQLRSYLLNKNQINGNYYRKIPEFNNHSGVDYLHLSEITQAQNHIEST